MKEQSAFHRGTVLCLCVYLLWGILPIYWKSISGVDAFEILANRVIWSALFVFLLIKLSGRSGKFYAESKQLFANKKRMAALIAAGVTITGNWGLFIWAVASGHIIETSMGYYINPLVSVLVGVFYLRERLNNFAKIAVLLAGFGVASMIWSLGVFPWISVLLALTFAFYALVKKMLPLDTLTGVFWETVIVAPLAIVYLFYLGTRGEASWQSFSWVNQLFLAGAGVVTATPLILFTGGAKLLPLSVVGFCSILRRHFPY